MIAAATNFLTIKDICNTLPTRPHRATVHRWILRGARGRKLKATFIGGRTLIAESDLRDFLSQNSEASVSVSRQAELRRVDRELDDLLK